MGRRGTGARDPRCPWTFLIVIASFTFLLVCCRRPPQSGQAVAADNKAAHIMQFYARDPTLPLGEKTLLCYGVDGAKKVHLEPPVDRVWPALSRCIEIAPTNETTYTLTAEGENGREVTQSVTVKVGSPLVKILEVSVNSLTVKSGERVSVCYKVKNARSVTVVPGRDLNIGTTEPGHGCVFDNPKKTTSYAVTATGADGTTDTEHVTVHVK